MKKIREKTSILSYLILILIGSFITVTIFSYSIQLTPNHGILLGFFLNGLLTSLGFYYTEERTKLRIITWSIIITLLALLISYIFTINYIDSNLEIILNPQ